MEKIDSHDENISVSGKISPSTKIYKAEKNNKYRFNFIYKSSVIKSEDIIILDSKPKDKKSGSKICVYKIYNNLNNS